MAHGNPKVQQRLFDRMFVFLKIEGARDLASELFVEIFAGNKTLCLRIPSYFISEIVNDLAKNSNPTLIRLLTSLVIVDNSPVKRNQQLIVNALLQYKNSIGIIMDSTTEERIAILSADEKKKSTAERQCYLGNMVYLLACCSQGDIKTVESICQTMFNLPELFDIILLSNLCNGLRSPFVQYIYAVYFTSHLKVAEFELMKIAHEPKLWLYLDSLISELRRLATDVLHDQATVRLLLKSRPLRIHASKSDITRELHETLHYFFDAVLPLITVFYKEFYMHKANDTDSIGAFAVSMELNDSDMIAAEEQISVSLLSALLEFATEVHGFLTLDFHRRILVDAVQAIVEATEYYGRLPPELNLPMVQHNDDPLTRYRNYYAEEQRLNEKLCAFIDNLQLSYGGPNTIQSQIGFSSNKPYIDPNIDCELTLGHEFQELVSAFIDKSADNVKDTYSNVKCLIRQLANSLNTSRISESNKQRLAAVNIRSLRILRGILYNEIVKIPDDIFSQKRVAKAQEELIKEVQNALVDMDVLEAILPHLRSSNEELPREVFAMCNVLLHGGNQYVQARFVKIFMASREEPFFTNIKARMAQTEATLRERRLQVYKRLTADQKQKHSITTQLLDMKLKTGKTFIDDVPLSTNRHKDSFASVTSKRRTFLGSIVDAFRPQQKRSRWATEIEMVAPIEADNRKILRRSTGAAPRHDCALSLQVADKLHLVTDTCNWSWLIAQQKKIIAVEQKLSDYEEELINRENGHLKLILQVLAGMCDGQNFEMQEYLRYQKDNLKTIDMVAETCEFLPLLMHHINEGPIS
uniref:RyR/IP3R Homology associated domain-containing protein n=1 Tax=Plectus sambesii TaxID=2011161 RepID=A0A914VH50_9BILA